MTTTTWAEIACTVPEAMVDPLSVFLVEVTGSGVTIDNLTLDTFSLDTLQESPIKTVKAYLPADDCLEQRVALISGYLAETGPGFAGFVYHPPVVTILSDEEWATSWKKHFKPSRIGRRLVIKPTWEPYDAAAADIVLELDPGMAFGTGTHATTRLCLEALEELFFREGALGEIPLPPRPAVLDVGCGSGILGIAAARFGAGRVLAIDIDPVAVEVTAENALLNGVEQTVTPAVTPLAQLTEPFSLVLANILAEELVRLAGELVERLAPGGVLILSGILREREEYVREGFSPFALSLVGATHGEDWSCLVYRKAA